MNLLAEIDALLHSLTDLGVRIRAGREIAVRLLLLGNNRDIGDASALKNRGNGDKARTVERRVDKLKRSAGNFLDRKVRHAASEDGLVITLETGVVNPLDKALLNSLIEVHRLHAGKRIGLGDSLRNCIGGLTGDLAAVGAIGLIAVIRRRIMASGHANTTGALKVADGPGKRRHGRNLRIHESSHAVCCKNGSRRLNEQLTFIAAIASDGDRRMLEGRIEVVSESLGRTTDRIDIHTVSARTDSAAKASSTEGEILEESVGDGVLITLLLHRVKLSEELLVLDIGNPSIKQLMNICHVSPSVTINKTTRVKQDKRSSALKQILVH